MTTADIAAVVGALGEHLLELHARARVAPSLVRVSVGDVTVEMGWPTNGQPANGSSPASDLDVERGAAAAGPVTAPVVAPVVAPGAEPGTFPLCSSSVGVFYRSPEPGATPFVVEGDTALAGQQVAIVEAMKLMIPLTAERPGRVVGVLVDDASPVEHGQPLFLFEPLPAAASNGRPGGS